MSRQRLALAAAVVLFGTLAVGAGAFTSVDADRGVRVAVADDDSALLGVQALPADASGTDRDGLVSSPAADPGGEAPVTPGPEVGGASENDESVFQLENRFGDTLTVDDVTVVAVDGDVDPDHLRATVTDPSVGIGETTTIQLSCTDETAMAPGGTDVTVRVGASVAGDTSVTAERATEGDRVRIVCP